MRHFSIFRIKAKSSLIWSLLKTVPHKPLLQNGQLSWLEYRGFEQQSLPVVFVS